MKGVMLKLKLQYFGHLMWIVDSLEKTLMLGGTGAGGKGDDREWNGWMASLTRWTWVWVDSRSWWWTGRPFMLWFMGLQSVKHDWATNLNWTELTYLHKVDECNCLVVWTFIGIVLWDWRGNWLFPALWPLLSFPNFLAIEHSIFTVSYFRIWNSSTGISSPPLALFVVMLRKAHLASLSRMLALCEWSHHCDYISREDLFV